MKVDTSKRFWNWFSHFQLQVLALPTPGPKGVLFSTQAWSCTHATWAYLCTMAHTSHTAQEFSFWRDQELCFSNRLFIFPWCSLSQATFSCLRRILQCHILRCECNSLNAVVWSPASSQNKLILGILLPETDKSCWWLAFFSDKNTLDSHNSIVQGFSDDSPGRNNKPTAPSGESASQRHWHTGIKIKTRNQHLIISRIYLQKKLIGH